MGKQRFEVEKSITVYKSTKYDLFQFILGNRPIKEAIVKKIIKSVQSGVDYLKYNPILVTDSLEIIDGQHRFESCKRMDSPVYFSIVPQIGVKDIALLNANQSSWGPTDWLNYHASQFNDHYIRLIGFMEVEKLTLTLAINFLGWIFGGGKLAIMKSGTFKVKDQSKALAFSKHFRVIAAHLGKSPSGNTARALMSAYDIEGYDYKRMESSCENYPNLFDEYTNRVDILRMWEGVYNYNRKDSNRLRFF